MITSGVLALVVGLGLGLAGPSTPLLEAAPSGALAGHDGVLYDDTYGPCTASTYDWSVSADTDWTILVVTRNPAGDIAASDLFSSASGSSGTHDLSICDGAGTYTIDAEVTVTDGSSPPVALPTASFAMRKAPTRSRLKVSDTSPRPGQSLGMRLRTSHRLRSGWEASENARMRLQGKKPGGRWSYLTGPKPADSDGALSLHYVWTGKVRVAVFRAVTVATDRNGRSFSDPVTVTQSARR